MAKSDAEARLDDLLELDLITRRAHPTDGRKTLVELTDEEQELLAHSAALLERLAIRGHGPSPCGSHAQPRCLDTDSSHERRHRWGTAGEPTQTLTECDAWRFNQGN